MARRGHTNIDSMQDESPLGLQNSFIAGLKTEFTGLNFPPNAAVDTDNCIYTMLGDVTRRKGMDFEDNYKLETLNSRDIGTVLNTYEWRNAGGDGESIVIAAQVGTKIYFYLVTAATVASPLSHQKLASVVDMATFAVAGTGSTVEVQYADGNGYLFLYSEATDPVYCTYDPIAKTVTASKITLKIRDFLGIPETGVDPTHRDTTITQEHEYNLRNQGWTRAPLWSVTASDNSYSYFMGDGTETIPLSFTGNGNVGIAPAIGAHFFFVAPSLPISVGTPVDINYVIPSNIYDIQAVEWHGGNATGTAKGIVKTYDSATGGLGITITFTNPVIGASNLEFLPAGATQYTINSSKSINTIDTFYNATGQYPGNADIWWLFKNQEDDFDPATTIGNKGLPSAWAPKGHYVLEAFNQQNATAANILQQYGGQLTTLQSIVTHKRPTTGTWFQGRVWYAGVDDSQGTLGDQKYYTWTENIYFSKVIESLDDFGFCYEENDPTDQYSFNLLPSDGGVITIQGAGAVFRLFPIQNGMLVFAANGVWFITGSQGIGFSAVDYTITKISAVRSISNNSFVDVNGLPFFWNEEGIYTVAPAQQGLGLTVEPLTVGTIKSFYDEIPYDSKKTARGAYNPVDYIIQWLYKDVSSVNAQAVDSTVVVQAAGMPFTGYTVVSGATQATECNRIFDLDTFGGFNYHTVPGYGFVDLYTIPSDTHSSILSSYFTNFIGLVNIHGLPGGVFATRGSYANGSGPNNAVYIFKNDGTLVRTIADNLTVTGLNESTMISNNGTTLFGITTSAYFHKAQLWRANYTSSSSFDLAVDVANADFDTNGCHIGNTYAYAADTTTSGTNRYNHLRRIRVSDMSYIDIDLTSIGGAASYSYDPATDHVLVITSAGTIYKYSADMSSLIGTSTVGLIPNISVGMNSQKRMCPGDGFMYVGAQRPLTGVWDLYKIDTNSLTVNVQYASTDAPGGVPIAPVSDATKPYDWVIWNAGQTGFYICKHLFNYDFWPLPRPAITATVILNADTYQFNRILNYNTFTKAFYPWTINDYTSTNNATTPSLHSISYVADPGGLNGIPTGFRYFCSTNTASGYQYTFADATDETYKDWDYSTETALGGYNYSSYFITGYSLFGQGLRKFQPLYLEMYSRLNETNMKYYVQGLWDFGSTSNSGKWSTRQLALLDKSNFSMAHKRHKIRGNGHAIQLKVNSVDNSPFDIMGWNMQITQNAGM